MGVRVLLVEDNPDHALLTKRSLERDARIDAVDVREDVPGALDYLEAARSSLPDVILVDLKLPGLSGFDLLDRIQADPVICEVPVVILSTSAREREVTQGIERGARAFLTKPLRVEELLERVFGPGGTPAGQAERPTREP
jgi:CheY-like chemotaxis protein